MPTKLKRALHAIFPRSTTTIILMNILLFVTSLYSGEFNRIIVMHQYVSSDPNLVDMIVSIFLHGSWSHLIGNMIILYVMGIVLEHKLGSTWFTFSYFITGFAGAIMFSFMSDYPQGAIGASGAIYGLMGIFVGMFPLYEKFKKHWLDWTVEIFLLILVLWSFHFTLMAGLNEPLLPIRSGVANWAHVGGFAMGVLLGIGTELIHSIHRNHPEKPHADNN